MRRVPQMKLRVLLAVGVGAAGTFSRDEVHSASEQPQFALSTRKPGCLLNSQSHPTVVCLQPWT